MALNKHNNYLYLSLILDNFKNPQTALHLYLRLLPIFVGGSLLVLSLIGIRQRVRLENGYDIELETDLLAMVGENRK